MSKTGYRQSELGKLCKTFPLNMLTLVLFICQVLQVCKGTVTERRQFGAFKKDLIMLQKPNTQLMQTISYV